MSEVIAVPPGTCPGLDDHYAITTNALRAMLVNDEERETRHAVELAECRGEARVEKAGRQSAEAAAEKNGWWRQWGAPLILGGIFAGFAAGTAVGVAIGSK